MAGYPIGPSTLRGTGELTATPVNTRLGPIAKMSKNVIARVRYDVVEIAAVMALDIEIPTLISTRSDVSN
jgi:hypothetical protein